MPEITTFGKRFYFLFLQDLGEKKSSAKKQWAIHGRAE
jgi:hypothetical protein